VGKLWQQGGHPPVGSYITFDIAHDSVIIAA